MRLCRALMYADSDPDEPRTALSVPLGGLSDGLQLAEQFVLDSPRCPVAEA